MTKKIYIAGPVTGVKGYRNNFRRVAALLETQGFKAVDPTAPGEVAGADYRYYINRGLRLLEECDFIAMLPGSEKSPGARLELHYASLVGLPVIQISEGYDRVLGVDMVADYEAG